MKIKNTILLIAVFALLSAMFPAIAHGRSYFIISNYDQSRQSMSASQIKSFLRGHNSCLGSMTRNGHSIAWYIKHYSSAYGINPQVVLATLQKEQSLVTTRNCSSYALRWAMGWGSSSNLVHQLKYGTRQFDLYRRYPNSYNHKAKQASIVDGQSVTPANQATAGQLNYTPHIHGTQLFKRIFNNWFAANLPAGMYVKKIGIDRCYQIIPGNKKRPLKSCTIAYTYVDPRNIVELSGAQLSNYQTNLNWVKFPDGIAFLAPWGTFYVSQDGQRHGVPNPDVRNRMGYETRDAYQVHSGVVVNHPEGWAFNGGNRTYADGTLLRAEGEAGVWYINGNKRYAFWTPQLRDHYMANHKVIVVPRSVIDKYKYVASGTVKYPPGNLIGLNGAVFFIGYDKKKHPITSRETFDGLGFNMDAVNWEHPDVLNLYPTGSNL